MVCAYSSGLRSSDHVDRVLDGGRRREVLHGGLLERRGELRQLETIRLERIGCEDRRSTGVRYDRHAVVRSAAADWRAAR